MIEVIFNAVILVFGIIIMLAVTAIVVTCAVLLLWGIIGAVDGKDRHG